MKYKNHILWPVLCLLLTLMPHIGFSADLPSPTNTTTEFIQYDAKAIAKVKQSLRSGQAAEYTKKAYRNLLTAADNALVMTNPSVINKVFFPPSNNKHDYLSLSRYWWPDPQSKDGLPWVRRDGITNPSTQTDDVDRKRLGRMVGAVKSLSLAYYFSDDEKYAKKASSLINTWFIDETTRMSPHLNYSQSVPGNPHKRRSGILDGRIIPERILDVITLISSSSSWSDEKDQQMNLWLSQYLSWLTTSKLGISAATQTNNHGSWYRFQVAALAWYLHDDTLLKKTIIATQQSLPVQFNAQGMQAHEVKRTRGFFYSCFNLQALARVANIAEKENLSLWQYQSEQGYSLQLAIDYLMPVAKGKKWPHASKEIQLSQLAMVLGEMVPYTDDPQYLSTLRKILTDIEKKQKLSSHEERVYYHFALLKPELIP